MANKIFLVTGVTPGIGKGLTLAIAKTDETLVMVVRDAERGQAV